MIRVVYRIAAAENAKPRPPFYSKVGCLGNFLVAFRAIKHGATFDMVCDGELPQHCDKHLSSVITLHRLAGVGNAASCRYSLDLALAFQPNDLVYFVEDDYLHLPEALARLAEAGREVPFDYLTLYDHPVRYYGPESALCDLPLVTDAVHKATSHAWRTVESTCMTFAARVRTLREDINVVLKHVPSNGVPRDRELFRDLQGLGQYDRRGNRRLLFGPVPSLATHCELPWLAPGIEWQLLEQ